MKIMAQEEYGLRCLLRFARAGADSWLTIPEIATAEKLSNAYVAKLLAVLRQADLIESSRGRSGGYHLAVPPAQIGLGSVLLVLGEPLFDEPGYCQRHAGTESDGACVHQDDCTLRALWQGLETWMKGMLDRISLADLLQNENRITGLLQANLGNVIADTPPLIHLTLKSRE
jgi:Rrf2 family transcriptional regulator, iron-sulfur cluster assembly transcription factor